MTNFEKILNNISNIVGKNKSFNYKLKRGELNIYWGIKVNKNIDFKIFFIINKIIELISLGNNITILVADIHTILDKESKNINEDTNIFISKLHNLIDYYNLPKEFLNKINIIKGSQFQLSKDYMLDLFKLIGIHGSIKDYCSEFELDIDKISFNNVLHPIMQTLDEEHLKKITCNEIDCQIGYSCNIKQYVFSKKHMKTLGFKPRTYMLYSLPLELIDKPFYLNLNNFISYIYTFNEEILLFLFNSLIEIIVIKNLSSTEEINERENMFLSMTINDKCKTIVDIIINIKLEKI